MPEAKVTKPIDDLEAVRNIADTLEPFSNDERERILRWVKEKLGMDALQPLPAGMSGTSQSTPIPTPAETSKSRDIRSFIQEKDPKNDSQLAAVVAYFHRFMTTEDQRKDSITSADLIEACRQSDRARPSHPAQTLVNAYSQGLLNRGDRGQYSINTVGENLVAMVLPDETGTSGARRTANRRSTRKKSTGKKPTRKKAARRKTTAKKATPKKTGIKKTGQKRTAKKPVKAQPESRTK